MEVLAAEALPLVCDVKDSGDDKYYRISEQKVGMGPLGARQSALCAGCLLVHSCVFGCVRLCVCMRAWA